MNVAMLTLLLVKERREEQESPPVFRLRGPDRTAEQAGSGPRAVVCLRAGIEPASWAGALTMTPWFIV